MERQPKFNVGDHVSFKDEYFGKITGVIAECIGLLRNVNGPGSEDFCYRIKEDGNDHLFATSEKKIKRSKKPAQSE